MNQKGNVILWVGVVVIGMILALGVGMGIKYYQEKAITIPEAQSALIATTTTPTQASSQSSIPINETGSWKTYINKDLNISFEYLAKWGEPIISSSVVDLSRCSGASMKTYFPDLFRYSDQITFSGRDSDHLYIGLVRFDQANPNGCDDSGVVNLIEKKNEFLAQPIGIEEDFNGFKTGTFKNDQDNMVSYYPDFYDSIGTGIAQFYVSYGSNLLVQAVISFNPFYGSEESNELKNYECTSEEKYGTCGLTEWLRKGESSASLRIDFDGLDHLMRTFKFTN